MKKNSFFIFFFKTHMTTTTASTNPLPLHIAGKKITSDSTQDIIYPYDGSTIDSVCLASPQHIDQAIEQAQASLVHTKKLAPYQKWDILRNIMQWIQDQHEEFSQLLARENGKTISESRVEIDRTINTFRIAAAAAEQEMWESFDLGISQAWVWRHAIVSSFPIGVVAGIVPFNFPMNLAAHKIAPAIATWCPIIIKPASATPLTMLKLADIVATSGLPAWAFSVVPCSREVWQQLVEDDRIALLSFTWSPHVGWKMKAQSNKKKVVLELGWNAAVIIDKNIIDRDHLIKRCITGAYYQAGQVCISVQRILVHQDIRDEFVQKFLQAIDAMVIWDPLDPKTDMWGMIDKKNADRILERIDEALEAWATCLAWNKRLSDTLLAPTLLENVPMDCNVVAEEAFGPVAVLDTFATLQEAIDKVNDSVFGLQVGVFSDNIQDIRHIFEESVVWWVIHNDVPSFRVDSMPYGWVKDSGLWREGIRYAMDDMQEKKVLVVDTRR